MFMWELFLYFATACVFCVGPLHQSYVFACGKRWRARKKYAHALGPLAWWKPTLYKALDLLHPTKSRRNKFFPQTSLVCDPAVFTTSSIWQRRVNRRDVVPRSLLTLFLYADRRKPMWETHNGVTFIKSKYHQCKSMQHQKKSLQWWKFKARVIGSIKAAPQRMPATKLC